MSRIGYAPITVPDQVTVAIDGLEITISGPKGTLRRTLPPQLTVEQVDGELRVGRLAEDRHSRSVHGLTRALLNNMVVGVTTGHSKALLITGIGFRAEQVGRLVKLSAGLSHPVMVAPDDGLELKVEGNNRVVVSGLDKELVGDMAARIRGVRPIKPYIFRGDFQGLRYADEKPRRKAGKQGV